MDAWEIPQSSHSDLGRNCLIKAFFDSDGNRVKIKNPLGQITTTVYDINDRPVSSINPLGNRYTFVYDENGQKVKQIDPLTRITTSIYNSAGNQTGRIDARGNRTTYTFDAASQLTSRKYPDGSRATFTYDSRGNRTLQENGDIAVTTTYDALNRPDSVTSDMAGAKKTVGYAYDAAGNRSNMIDPDGGRFTYAYNANNQISSLRNPQDDRTTFSYNAAGQRTVKKLANGTRASYSYDAARNTTRVANLKSDSTTISSYDYRFDADNRQTSIIEADGSRVTYLYDAASRFTGEHRTGTTPYRNTFTYDSADNRTLKNESGSRTTYSYDSANQLTTSIDFSGTTTYTFDANGNQQLVVAPGNNRTTTTWDYENRTSTIILPSSIRNTMLYNPDGLRVELQESTGTKRFIWDGQVYLGETDGTNATQVVYTNEPDYYGSLTSQYRKSGGLFFPSYYHQNALGSTMQLSGSSENITDTYLYDGWGNVIASTGSTENPFQFTGQVGYYFDSDTGNFYIRARTYRPTIARWLSVDPIGLSNNLNLFSAEFIPYLIDPTGLEVIKDPKCAAKCTAVLTGCVGLSFKFFLECILGALHECRWICRFAPGQPCGACLAIFGIKCSALLAVWVYGCAKVFEACIDNCSCVDENGDPCPCPNDGGDKPTPRPPGGELA